MEKFDALPSCLALEELLDFEPHHSPHFLGAGDFPTGVLDVLQETFRCWAQPWNLSNFGDVSVHFLHSAIDILILPM